MGAMTEHGVVVKPAHADREVGAEVVGVDLSQPLDAARFKVIEDALQRYGVLWLRGQNWDDAQQKRFSHLWGEELDIHPFTQYGKPGHPEVFVLSNIRGEDGKSIGAEDAAQYWHTDLSYTRTPSRVSILYSVEIPRAADGSPLGDTEFASTRLAWEALPADMKQRLEGLKAAHLAQKPKVGSSGFMKKLDDKVQERLDEVVHPVVRTHPHTGQKCLYVNHGFTTRIIGMPEAESDALLNELYDHIVQPQFMHAHKWAPGDILMWDNCSTIHQGVGNYKWPQRRLIYRTIVKGSVPF